MGRLPKSPQADLQGRNAQFGKRFMSERLLSGLRKPLLQIVYYPRQTLRLSKLRVAHPNYFWMVHLRLEVTKIMLSNDNLITSGSASR